MTLALPQPGQVIRYAYLWWSEARSGATEGLKDRPCGVVLTRTTREQETLVYVLPITHRAPEDSESGIEIPRATKERLGLDGERSWIITSELNRFIWPGPDLRALPTGEYSYGYLPAKLVRAVLDQVRANASKGAVSSVTRSP